MSPRRLAGLRRQALCCGLLALSACRIGVASEGEFLSCRSIGDATARLACYDRATASGDSPAPTLPATPSPPTPSPPIETPDLFGLPADEVRKRAEYQLGQPTPDVLEARITGLTRLATGKFEVELDNGQRWQQVDTTAIHVKPGENVRIRRGALGSYLLQRASGGAAARVRRLLF